MSRTATAAVLRTHGTAPVLDTVTVPELRPDEVLVRIAGVGICHTDLTAAAGGVPLPLPAVLGHEGAGVVVETGDAVTGLAVGDAVVLGFDSCRTCRNCTRGRPAYCTRFAPLNYGGRRSDGSTTLLDSAGKPVHGNWFGQSSFSSLVVATTQCTPSSQVPGRMSWPWWPVWYWCWWLPGWHSRFWRRTVKKMKRAAVWPRGVGRRSMLSSARRVMVRAARRWASTRLLPPSNMIPKQRRT